MDPTGTGSSAEAFHATIHSGQGSIWQHWQTHFAQPYAKVPGLEPLPVVYARPDSDAMPPLPDDSGGALDQPGASSAVGGRRKRPTLGLKGRPVINGQGVARAVGRRKTSVAEVRVAHGEGRIFINDQPFDEAIRDLSARQHIVQPFLVTDSAGLFDVVVRVHGGGPSSAAQAVQHGIAKALTLLLERDKASKLLGMVQWDPRRVERKKPGRRKARTGFAYVRR